MEFGLNYAFPDNNHAALTDNPATAQTGSAPEAGSSAPVAIIIVSYESADWLQEAVRSAASQSNADDKIIVWDNGSSAPTQAELDRIQLQWPQVHIERCQTNLGFAAANNAAARLAPAMNLCLLNPDARFQEGALDAVKQALSNDQNIGAVGCIQITDDGHKIDGLGDAYHYSGLPWRMGFGTAVASLSSQTDIEPPTTEIFSPCAAAALYRRQAFDEANGFDEDYFCYCEDSDLGFRLRLAGWRCVRANQAIVRHVGSASTGANSDFSVYHGQRNMVWTFTKNMPGALLPALIPTHLAINAVIVMRYLLAGRASVILRAKRDAFLGLRRNVSKRKQIQRQRQASWRDIWRVIDKSVFQRT